MTAPEPLTPALTRAVGAPLGRLHCECLDACAAAGRAPVIMLRRTAGDDFRHATLDALKAKRWASGSSPGKWGLGGWCTSAEDAGNFAIAGCTWFSFDLAAHIEARAEFASLDELDARIVALEDEGVYPPGWHDRYAGRLDDEPLARACVKFAPALAAATAWEQAIRTAWTGHGSAPDVEYNFTRTNTTPTALEFEFISEEARIRSSGIPVVSMNGHPSATHEDHTFAATLGLLRKIAAAEPAAFRALLSAARDAFPTSRQTCFTAISEDDIRLMPEATDEDLAALYLDTPQGHGLFQATEDTVLALAAKIFSA